MRGGVKRQKTRSKEQEGEKARVCGRLFFQAPQTDAGADGGELTENGRRRNEEAYDGPMEGRH